MAEVKTKETIPFWLAVGITAIVFLPLTIFLGKYNIPLWVSFIVWAEFFNFGATVKKAWKFILIAFPASCNLRGWFHSLIFSICQYSSSCWSGRIWNVGNVGWLWHRSLCSCLYYEVFQDSKRRISFLFQWHDYDDRCSVHQLLSKRR